MARYPQVDSSGRVRVQNGGIVVGNANCCCGSGEDPIIGACCRRIYSDRTEIPSKMRLFYADVQLCACQNDNLGGSFKLEFEGGGWFSGGELVLDKLCTSIFGCRWLGSFPRGYGGTPERYRYVGYSEPDCAGTPSVGDWLDLPEEDAFSATVIHYGAGPPFPGSDYPGDSLIRVFANGFGFGAVFKTYRDDFECSGSEHDNQNYCEVPDPPPNPTFPAESHYGGYAVYTPEEYVNELDVTIDCTGEGFGPEDFE